MDTSPILIELKYKLIQAQKTLMEGTLSLETLRVNAPVSDEEFMAVISPLYNAGFGELLESVDIDQLRQDLTETQ